MKTMKTFSRRIAALLLVVTVGITALAPAASASSIQLPRLPKDQCVVDDAGVLSDSTTSELETINAQLSSSCDGAQIGVLTVDYTGSATTEDYAAEAFDTWGIGSSSKNNGVLILLVMQSDQYADGDYYLTYGDGFRSTMLADQASSLVQTMEDDFAAKKYDAAVLTCATNVANTIAQVYGVTLSGGTIYSDGSDTQTTRPSVEPVPPQGILRAGSGACGAEPLLHRPGDRTRLYFRRREKGHLLDRGRGIGARLPEKLRRRRTGLRNDRTHGGFPVVCVETQRFGAISRRGHPHRQLGAAVRRIGVPAYGAEIDSDAFPSGCPALRDAAEGTPRTVAAGTVGDARLLSGDYAGEFEPDPGAGEVEIAGRLPLRPLFCSPDAGCEPALRNFFAQSDFFSAHVAYLCLPEKAASEGAAEIDTTMNVRTKGLVCGAVAAATYGMNPLFTLPLYHAGMTPDSVLFYRYAFALPILAVMIRLRGQDFSLRRCEMLPLVAMGLLFSASSLFLYMSYNYMDAGIASTILFVYPILVALIMALGFRERITPLTIFCIALAVLGIGLLYEGDGQTLSLTGVTLVLLSSLSYAVYIVGVNRSALAALPTVKLTFYALLFGLVIYVVRLDFLTGLQAVPSWYLWGNVLALAALPTAVSLLCTTQAIHYIGSTPTAILGALEPVTAVFFGVVIFYEELTARLGLGIALILVAVTLIVAGGRFASFLLRFRRLFPKRHRKTEA